MTRQNPPRDERTLARDIKGILRRLRILETASPLKTPFADLLHSTTQAIATSTTTAITFNTPVSDTHGGYNAANPTRYTAPINGVYLVAVQAPWAANITGKRELWLRRSDGVEYQTQSVWPSTALAAFLSVCCPVPMLAGTYVEADVWQNSGGNLNLDNTIHGGQHMLVQWIAKL